MSSSLVTQGVRISVQTTFVPEQSSHRTSTYVFAYTISIFNESDTTIQLLTRYWRIVDANMDVRFVNGEGVCGKQPILHPGESHVYTSGCMLRTPVGKMEGYYGMIRLPEGRHFEVTIPPFVLITPPLLN
ncbi:MAG: Co2+/Mg2+ efflux protein ApaG [Bacteroidia bacterium]|nr:Co2+/Mg2+ efflux protein ApaG [Bacteroidia bacterium]MDW8332603.1 Co2+/Mg2+ efflux protein ApaG [Bacteroidia bacterium]